MTMRASFQIALWIALLLSGRPLSADLPDAEPSRHFLRRPPLSAYANYGEDLYRPYRREIRLAPRYDFLGRFLAEGFLVYELDEQRPGGSRIRKDRLYRSLNNLIIAHDSYGPWHWSLTVGDEVRTEFTPLTLRQAGFNGLRWDVVFPANKITLLTTRGFDSSLFPTLNSFSDPVAQGRGSLIDYLERTEEKSGVQYRRSLADPHRRCAALWRDLCQPTSGQYSPRQYRRLFERRYSLSGHAAAE